MQPVFSHAWPSNVAEALQLQAQLAPSVLRTDRLNNVQRVAGVDVAYAKQGDQVFAAVVILDAQTLNVVETAVAEDVTHFPYLAGLFSFRELPPIMQALAQLKQTPDLIICDGQGLAHPKRFGLACHLGILYDIPTLGCGKTRLIGQAERPAMHRGAYMFLYDKLEIVGAVLRTQTHVNPVYVSIGHRIALETACAWVLKLTPKYRLPETTRMADQLVKSLLKHAD